MHFPDISPVALQIGPLAIRWYALAYVVGILLAQYLMMKLDDRAPVPMLSKAARDSLVMYGVLGIILGGRVGYILFYNFSYFLENPHHMFAVWEGGMSFHGGLIGVTLAFLLFARRFGIRFLSMMDLIAVVAPLGLFFGRLANFVNGELYGRVTESPLGMVFPRGGPLPRHPSQLYEAALEGVVLFTVMWLVANRTRVREKPGFLAGLFITGYGIARFSVEFVREPDVQLGLLTFGLSMGQLLCLPMLALGVFLMVRAKRY